MNSLQQLAQFTHIVADTGDLQAITRLRPMDATTNPSLILKAVQSQANPELLSRARSWQQETGHPLLDCVLVSFGLAIKEQIPGYISTEADPSLSYDCQATVNQARRLIQLYQRQGVPKEQVLIKIAATWEGIQAANILQSEGIQCNITLIFSLMQARAAAQAGARLISPFVGRILDWYKQQQPEQDFSGEQDPGVQSVRQIHQFYQRMGYQTIVMGASFRNVEQIIGLAGCDKLTISPSLLDQLQGMSQAIEPCLQPTSAPVQGDESDARVSQNDFLLALSQDPMASQKLPEGIRLFMADQQSLLALLAD